MRRSRHPNVVDWGGRLVSRALVEVSATEVLAPGVCARCGGLGEIPETIDAERFDVMMPCHSCHLYCVECDAWVPRNGHKCKAQR